MKSLGRKRIKIIKYISICLAIAITLLILMFNSGVAVLRQISGYVVNPVIKAADATIDGIGNFFASFGSRMRLKEELAAAQEKLMQFENIQSVADEVKAENNQLMALLGESEKYPEFEYQYAKVILRSVDDYSATYTLNKGENDGIRPNMVVISSGGLAGKIIETTGDTSILLAITDSRCGVPALSEASRDMGIVKGVSDSGTTAGYCVMTEFPTPAITKPRDTVITSGIGEAFPKGITVGTITEVSKGNLNQINSSARLTPAVDFDHLENVLIITNTGE